MYDLLLMGARVVDGTGNPWFRGDVGIAKDRIAAVGRLAGASARRVVEIGGAVLAPGFVDLHTHADFTLPVFPRADAMVRQGVTTQLVGNCGFSPFPVRRGLLEPLRAFVAFVDAGISWKWDDAAGYAAHLEGLPLACNVALQVGHGTVRIAAMGFDNRAPSPRELEEMQDLVAQALEQGAFALSSGLIYVPGSYALTGELIALARVAARFGAFYSSHIRGEGDTLLEAVGEALHVGREAGLPVQLSHHKATGRRNWGRVKTTLEMIDRAEVAGEFDLASIMISSVPEGPNRQYEGMMLPDIAAASGETLEESALHLLHGERGRVQMIVFAMSEDDLIRPGCAADLVVFDPDQIADRATYQDPHRFCEGVRHVIVNGQAVIEEGQDTGAPAGRVLRRSR